MSPLASTTPAKRDPFGTQGPNLKGPGGTQGTQDPRGGWGAWGPRGPSGPLGTVGVNADGDSEWMVIPSGWRLREDMGPRGPFKGGARGRWSECGCLFRVGGYSEWMVIPNGWLF